MSKSRRMGACIGVSRYRSVEVGGSAAISATRDRCGRKAPRMDGRPRQSGIATSATDFRPPRNDRLLILDCILNLKPQTSNLKP